MSIVYALCYPETGEVGYIGLSEHKTAEERLYRLVWEAEHGRDDRRHRWIRSLGDSRPTTRVLERDPDDLGAAERKWIARARSAGCRLVNTTAGGEGWGTMTEETRQQISRSLRGRKQSPEHRRAVREALDRPGVQARKRAAVRAALARPDVKARQRAASAASNARPEVRAKISEALSGRKLSAETRQRQRESKTPEVRARIAEGVRASWARRRERTS